MESRRVPNLCAHIQKKRVLFIISIPAMPVSKPAAIPASPSAGRREKTDEEETRTIATNSCPRL